jgi:photosystem II stability/assembly factor-like uncharacterized protein
MAAAFAAPAAASFSRQFLENLHWRQIGPFRGGRVAAVAGDPDDADTYYFGAAGAGVFKTTDGGTRWRPLFTRQPVSSIGAIAVAPSDPSCLYVGTGEANVRNDTGVGDGMYKSTNGGASWTHIGLTDTRHIGAIVVDPDNPDIVLVAALGHAYGPNKQRGVFRSTDGGQTWHKVLYENDRTGAIDLALDPKNPDVVYAAMWQMYRKPWHLESGGPGSGIYKSTDGGRSFKRIEGHGLPTGVMGRIGIAVAANGSRVYALIEAKNGGLYRSDDSGAHWKRVNSSQRFRQRAWYFGVVTADPKNPDRVYIGNVHLFRSNNGGRWFTMLDEPHPDNHALWIDPHDPARMILGHDGGASVSTNAGASWTRTDNQPTAQIYHVAADDQFPYHLYGAQQEWGTIEIASATNHGAITRHDWHPVGGGESGNVIPSPTNPAIVYGGSYFGKLTRFDKRTGRLRNVSPWPMDTDGEAAEKLKHRFTWTTPLAFSPLDPKTLYSASQVLMQTTDGGAHWTRISPDLTRNDKSKQGSSGGPITHDNSSAEYYDLIYAIAPSPLAKGEIWVGTDDGLVQLTRDGGESWQNVTPPSLPVWAKVAQIEASPFDPGTAFVAVDAHKLDNLAPYIFRTRDYGRTWTKITRGIDARTFVHVVRADPNGKGLLFAGTSTGVYVSFNNGGQWQPLKLNLPTVPVYDLIVHAGDLVVATHGRGFWVLDDISPLEQLKPAIATTRAHLFKPRPAYRIHKRHWVESAPPASGQNPPRGAIIDYYLGSAPNQPITLAIHDSNGRLVRRFTSAISLDRRARSLSASPGMHRFVWDLHYSRPRPIPGARYDMGRPIPPLARPGRYKLTLTVDGHDYSQPLEVKMDPRVDVSKKALGAHFDLMMKIRHDIALDHRVANTVRDLRKRLARVRRRFQPAPHSADPIARRSRNLDRMLVGIADVLWQSQAHASEAMLHFPARLNSKLAYLQRGLSGATAAPTRQDYAVYHKLHHKLMAVIKHWRGDARQRLTALNGLLEKREAPVLLVKKAHRRGEDTSQPSRATAQ